MTDPSAIDPTETEDQPSSLVSRWLAALVLVLLLGAGAHAAWWVFSGAGAVKPPPSPAAEASP